MVDLHIVRTDAKDVLLVSDSRRLMNGPIKKPAQPKTYPELALRMNWGVSGITPGDDRASVQDHWGLLSDEPRSVVLSDLRGAFLPLCSAISCSVSRRNRAALL